MNYTPAIGDFLVRPKIRGFVSHVGVLLSHNTVLQNTPEKGEHTATVPEFAAGALVKVLPTGANPSHVLGRARKALANPKPYHLFCRNCEHTATEVVRGVAKSPQLLIFGVIAFIVVMVLICWPRR